MARFSDGGKLTVAIADKNPWEAINGDLVREARVMAANELADDQAVIFPFLADVVRQAVELPCSGRRFADNGSKLPLTEATGFASEVFPQLVPWNIRCVAIMIVIEPIKRLEARLLCHQLAKAGRTQMHPDVVQEGGADEDRGVNVAKQRRGILGAPDMGGNKIDFGREHAIDVIDAVVGIVREKG